MQYGWLKILKLSKEYIGMCYSKALALDYNNQKIEKGEKKKLRPECHTIIQIFIYIFTYICTVHIIYLINYLIYSVFILFDLIRCYFWAKGLIYKT